MIRVLIFRLQMAIFPSIIIIIIIIIIITCLFV